MGILNRLRNQSVERVDMSTQDTEIILAESEELDHYIGAFIRAVEFSGAPTDKWFAMIKEAASHTGDDVIKNSQVIRAVLEHRFTERWAKFIRCWIRLRLQDAGFEELECGGSTLDDGRMSCMDSAASV